MLVLGYAQIQVVIIFIVGQGQSVSLSRLSSTGLFPLTLICEVEMWLSFNLMLEARIERLVKFLDHQCAWFDEKIELRLKVVEAQRLQVTTVLALIELKLGDVLLDVLQ